MEQIAALARAQEEFARRLAVVRSDQWGATTPCEHWTVTELVRHVVGGQRMAVVLMAGGSREDALAALRVVDDGQLVAAYDAACAESLAAFGAPGALERVVHHPLGDMSAAQLLGFRVGDLVLHSWDLARGVGGDDVLDPALVSQVWHQMEPMGDFLPSTGMFGEGASGVLADEAPLQERLLDLTGRRP